MRRSTPLAVLATAAVALATGGTALALANGAGAADRPGATFDMAKAQASTRPRGRNPPVEPTQQMAAGPVMTVVLVTVPELTTAEPSPALPPAPAPTPEATPATTTPTPPAAETIPTSEPAPSAPADAPFAPPYSAVLGWTGEGRVAYLTFDDGPGPYTGRVLDILAASGVKATFCQLGNRVTERPDLAARVVAEGHTLCNHSWDHYSPFDSLPPESLDQQIGGTQNAVTSATGVTPRYFRAPEGRFGDPGGAVLRASQRARTIPLGWAVDSLDWKRPGAATIVSNVLNAVTPGSVILLHDGGGPDRDQTLEALPAIINGLQAAGYTLAPLPPNPAG